MRMNMPVSNVERVMRDGEYIVSKTDTRGIITYVNPYFLEISGFSEAELLGLPVAPSTRIRTPRLANAPISMECRLIQTLELGHKPTRSTIILGEVLMVHIKDEVITQGKIDPLKAKIIARLGDSDIYCRTTDIFKMKRL